MTSGMQDFYAELDVDSGVDLAAIKKSYRQLVLKYHPDKNPENREAAEEKIRKINIAYETLGNPAKRAAYDFQHKLTYYKKNNIRLDTSMIRPRMAIPKAFMLCPVGHPDKFLRTVGKSLAFHSRSDVDDVQFDAFFTMAKFSLWWLPEVNNMCRLRTQPVIANGVVCPNYVLNLNRVVQTPGSAPSGSILSWGLSPNSSSSDIMLSNDEQPMCTNAIAVPSPQYPQAFRFQAAYFPGFFLTFDPPTHTQMMKCADQFAVVDFMLVDYSVAEQFRTLEEILIPTMLELGGDKEHIKLTRVCQHHNVAFYFKTVMGGVPWDFTDFASYFHAHSDTWDYDEGKQVLKMRGIEDKIGHSLNRARTAPEIISVLAKPSKQEIRWLSLETIRRTLGLLSKTSAVEGCQDAQKKVASILTRMCQNGEQVSLRGLVSLWGTIAGLKGSNVDADSGQFQSEVRSEVAKYTSKIIRESEINVDLQLLDSLLDMPLDWDKLAEVLSQKGQQVIAKEPLANIVPLMIKAAEAGAGKFGECLATSAMMKIFGAPPALAAEALDAMVSGGFGLEGAPMMLRMQLGKISAEAAARIAVGLAEHGSKGADFDACWKAVNAEEAIETLPVELRDRLSRSGERARSRSRGRRK